MKTIILLAPYFVLLCLSTCSVGCVDIVSDQGLEAAGQMASTPVVEREETYDMGVDGVDGAALPASDMRLEYVDMNTPLDSSSADDAQVVLSCYGSQVQCRGECINVDDDMRHCGGCDQACIISNGSGVCRRGRCEIESCEPRFFDQDNNSQNGCEYQDLCTPDQTCLSSCGSQGTSRCSQGALSCDPPPEVCNLKDDDCDGQCDESSPGLVCKVGVHRASKVFNMKTYHAYSTQQATLNNLGYDIERRDYFYLSQESGPNAVSLRLCQDQMSRHFLSTQSDCGINQAPIETLGYVLPEGGCHSQPLYHLIQPQTGNHLYTIDPDEVALAIEMYSYVDHGTLSFVWRNP